MLKAGPSPPREAVGHRGFLWFDATTLLRMRRIGPVGLSRVEAAVLSGALELPESQGAFCHFNRYTGTFGPLRRHAVQQLVKNYGTGGRGTQGGHGVNAGNPLRRAARGIERYGRTRFRKALGRITPWVTGNGSSIPFRPNDVLVISGATWGMLDPLGLQNLCETQRVRLAAVLADMVPWRFPHQFQDPVTVDRFLQFARVLAESAAAVFCISHSTQSDFCEFAKSVGVPHVPSEVMILGSEPPGASRMPAGLPHDLLARRYVLSVSTIQVRKNHQLLYHLWRRFAEEGRDDVPRLVLVGANGWLTEDLRCQIGSDPLVRDSIIVLNDAGDEELNWLYQNSQFTLYPSFYEGWGLPIVESLQHGKACLASNTSSMAEAGQGLAVHLDPLDFAAWYDAILHWVDNPNALTAAEETIRIEFQPRSWSDFSSEFLDHVTALTEQPGGARAA